MSSHDDRPAVAGVRGATTLDEDCRDEVLHRTSELLATMLERNGLTSDDVISLVFTATDDIRSEFPAAAVRAAGIADVPMLCARELGIESDSNIARCVRVLAHVVSPAPRGELRHTYLRGARQLRSDLPE
ncbi:MAG: chorismate mutase [Actinobacteria bacterium QS_8_72_14]|nr:MAG: chorismate mutase [Actinobacteria bacterium QS_8_72_14]